MNTFDSRKTKNFAFSCCTDSREQDVGHKQALGTPDSKPREEKAATHKVEDQTQES